MPTQDIPVNIEQVVIASPSPEVTTTNTPVSIPGSIDRTCPEYISSFSNDKKPTGLLIVDPIGAGTAFYFWNLQDNSEIKLGRTIDDHVVISPNRKILAYSDLDSRAIIITASGNQILEIPNEDERLTPRYWLDNQLLALEYRQSEQGGPFILPSLIVVNVFTGEKQEWLPDYPKLDTRYRRADWNVLSRFLPNANQTHVIYQAFDEWTRVNLWDIHDNQVVASIFNGNTDSTPWWSNNGKRFVTSAPPIDEYQGVTYKNIDDKLPYTGGTDLFIVSIEGDINRLTYFSVNQNAFQSRFTWSPDGKKIAFISEVSPPDGNIWDPVAELSVVDIDTKNVTNFCLPGYRLVWSPDSKYIVINQGINEQRQHTEAYIVDIENKSVWKVFDNAEVVGWMVQEP
jgi:hypothetical protein